MLKKHNQQNSLNYLQLIKLMEDAIAEFLNKLTGNIQKVELTFSPNNNMITYHENILSILSCLNKIQTLYFNSSKDIMTNDDILGCLLLSKKYQ